MKKVEIAIQSDGVALLSLNHPEKLNPLGDQLREELLRGLQELDSDTAVRCVVLTGNGRAFSAGGDVKGMSGRDSWQTTDRMFNTSQIVSTLMTMRKPTIAALNGLAVGAGASLALCCDIVLACKSAWMSFVFVERGLVPDFASSYFLPRVVGLSRAKVLALTAQRISADEAYELGIVANVFPDEDFEAEVAATASRLVSGNTHVMPLIRRVLNHSFETDFRSALEREALAQGLAVSHEGHKQDVARFGNRSVSD